MTSTNPAAPQQNSNEQPVIGFYAYNKTMPESERKAFEEMDSAIAREKSESDADFLRAFERVQKNFQDFCQKNQQQNGQHLMLLENQIVHCVLHENDFALKTITNQLGRDGYRFYYGARIALEMQQGQSFKNPGMFEKIWKILGPKNEDEESMFINYTLEQGHMHIFSAWVFADQDEELARDLSVFLQDDIDSGMDEEGELAKTLEQIQIWLAQKQAQEIGAQIDAGLGLSVKARKI